MISKRTVTLLACTAILSSTIASNVDQTAIFNAPQLTAQAVTAEKPSPIFAHIDNLVVASKNNGIVSSDGYTPANTTVALRFSDQVVAGDLFELKLVATNKESDLPMFKDLNAKSGPQNLISRDKVIVGTYEVIDANGTTVVKLNNKFTPGTQVALYYSGDTVDPHSDINSKGFSYVRMDAKLNNDLVSSTTFEMSVKPDNVIWVTNSVEVEELLYEDPIPFETERRENPDMLVGQEAVVQEGQQGIKRTTSIQTYIDGVPQGKPVIKEVIVKEPTPRIIEYGTGVEKEIPYKIEFRSDETIPFSHIYVVQEGQFGRSINNKVIIPPINQINHVGTLREEKATIDFNIQYVENPDLHEGLENVLQEGLNGEVIHQYRYELDPDTGKLSETFTTKDVTTVEMVPKIIEIGVGVEGIIPYDIIRVPNPTLEPGREIVLQDGVLGEKWNDEIVKKPVQMIIEYGPKLTSTIPFEIERVENSNLKPGEERISRPGVSGESIDGKVIKQPISQIVEYGPVAKEEVVPFETVRRPSVDLEEGKEKVIAEGVNGSSVGGTLIKTPISKIVEYGPKRIPFDKENKIDVNLNEGETVVIQEGKEGLVDEAGNILREPISQITAIGKHRPVKLPEQPVEEVTTTTDNNSEQQTNKIPYGVNRVANPELNEGEERVIQAGVDGEKDTSGKVIKEPIVEIIEFGIKAPEKEVTTTTTTEETTTTTEEPTTITVETTTTTEEPTTTTEETTTTTDELITTTETTTTTEVPTTTTVETTTTQQPAVKADVKTGVEDVAVNPTLIRTGLLLLGGLGGGLGFKFFKSKKKEDEIK